MGKIKLFYLAALMGLGLIIISSCRKHDDCTEQTWYQDADADGFGNVNQSQQSCTQPTGYVSDNTDFDDTNPALNPGAPEIPDNNTDENGDGIFAYYLFVDNDSDGFGAKGTSAVLVDVPNVINSASDIPSGYAQNDGDCNDTDDTIYPDAPENTTDGVDNNCNGYIDEYLCFVDQDCPIGMTCVNGICQ